MRFPTNYVLAFAVCLAGCEAAEEATVSVERQRVSTDNGLSFNGLSFNGLSFNGLSFNGLSFNGLSFNGALMADLEDTTLTPDGTMTKGEARREALAYVYKCAMPAGATLDLEIGGSWYTFAGALGLAPEWGASDDAVCDVACQRWVSACLLAHANYFGEHIQISVRGPHPALAGVGATEASEFDIQEGAFYGNLFLDSGVADEYYGGFACDGIGMNYSDITRRRCADEPGCSINLADPCSGGETLGIGSPTTLPAACNTTLNADGAYTTCGLFDGEIMWNEVITVYLNNPYYCGDSICQEGEENHETCPADCAAPPACGDGVCDAPAWIPYGGGWLRSGDMDQVESCGSCSADCGACPTCGNGACEAWEDCDVCPADCEPPPLLVCIGGYCGDGTCQADETCGSCAEDCNTCAGVCGNGSCEAGEDSSNCIADCVVRCGDGVCQGPAEDSSSCVADCPPVCGDGVCNGSEDCGSCATDCGACPPVCGDGVCEGGETCSSCSADCGACAVCGDGVCNGSEDCGSCATDCGACAPVCGDRVCEGDESCKSCATDCGKCETTSSTYCDGRCSSLDAWVCPSDCEVSTSWTREVRTISSCSCESSCRFYGNCCGSLICSRL